MALAASVYPPLDKRPFKDTVLLFDVDDTLTKPRQVRLPFLPPSLSWIIAHVNHNASLRSRNGR
jgi:phosphomannomutase